MNQELPMTEEELLRVIEQAAREGVTELDLSGKGLTMLPHEIGQLTSLRAFYLNNNQLSQLPAEIGQLTNLQSLDLSSNQLSVLPLAIRQLPNLKTLELRANPLPIPPEILGAKQWWEAPGDVNEILEFYFWVQDPNETEPLYEAKFLIVGEGCAGKTSLAKKIEDETYKLQSDEKSTQGIDVIQWEFHYNRQKFRVNMWDFGGQEIYHQTHQFFLTERSLYALVADTRKENTDHWEDDIKELDEGMRGVGAANLQGFREEIDQYTEIRNTIAELTNLLKDMNTLTPDIHSPSEFQDLIKAIEDRLEQDTMLF